MNGRKQYIQKRVNRNKTDIATKARMLGLPASAGAPALAETSGLAVLQLLPPCLIQQLYIEQSFIGPQASYEAFAFL